MRWTLSSVLWLFFSLRGRIGRAQWWAGVALLLIVGLPSIATAFEDIAKRYVVEIALFDLATLYPSYALDAKRFHDHDRSSLWGVFAAVPALLLAGLNFLSSTDVYEEADIEWIFIGTLLTIGLWYAIYLGCFRGVLGPNRFGADPLSSRLEQP